MYTVLCRVIVDNQCELQHFSSQADGTFDAGHRERNAVGQTNLTVPRFCQDDFRSPTVVEKEGHVQTYPPSHRTKSGSIMALQLCQVILAQLIECIRSYHTHVPTQNLSILASFCPGLICCAGRSRRYSCLCDGMVAKPPQEDGV